jgi:hypothetical protein
MVHKKRDYGVKNLRTISADMIKKLALSTRRKMAPKEISESPGAFILSPSG